MPNYQLIGPASSSNAGLLTPSSLAAIGPVQQTIAYASTVTPIGSNPYSKVEVSPVTGSITIANPSGSPVTGNRLLITLAIDSGGPYTIAFGTVFEFNSVNTSAKINTDAVASKVVYIGCIYCGIKSKWIVGGDIGGF